MTAVTQAPQPTRTRPPKKPPTQAVANRRALWFLLLPSLVPVVLFSVYPLLNGIWLGFTDAQAGYAVQNQAAGPQTLSVARQSKHPAEAMKFIAYFMKAENLAKVAEGDALIPVTTSASAIVKKDLAGKHGWDAILGSSASLVDSPWNKATKFPQWKNDTATPAFQEFLAGKIDSAALQQRLTEGWNKINS